MNDTKELVFNCDAKFEFQQLCVALTKEKAIAISRKGINKTALHNVLKPYRQNSGFMVQMSKMAVMLEDGQLIGAGYSENNDNQLTTFAQQAGQALVHSGLLCLLL